MREEGNNRNHKLNYIIHVDSIKSHNLIACFYANRVRHYATVLKIPNTDYIDIEGVIRNKYRQRLHWCAKRILILADYTHPVGDQLCYNEFFCDSKHKNLHFILEIYEMETTTWNAK